jgi:hypothetical protein
MPVLPSKPSSSAGLSKKLPSAACATGGFDEVVVVVVVDDDAGVLFLSLPQPAINIAVAATAAAAVRWRMSQIALSLGVDAAYRRGRNSTAPARQEAKRAPSESGFTAGSTPRRSQSPTG